MSRNPGRWGSSASRWRAGAGFGPGLGLLALLASCGGDAASPPDPPARAPGDGGMGAPQAPALEGPFTPRFLARRELAVPAKPVGLWAGDLTADGAAELVAVTQEPGLLLLWRGGQGGISAQAERTPIGDFPLAPVAMPDGRHLAIASRAEETVIVLDLSAAGQPREVARFELDQRPRALAAGDLFADGTPELVVATAGGELRCLGSDPSGAGLQLGLERPTCLHVLESGAGVVVGSQVEGTLTCVSAAELLGGDAGAARLVLPLGGIPRALAELDFNGDGDLELVCAGGDRWLWVFGLDRPGGDAGWWRDGGGQAVRLAAPGRVPIALLQADLDRDGEGELATLNYVDSSYGLLVRAADGERFALTEAAGQTPWGGALADLDGDDLPDLAVANRDALRISLLSGTGILNPEKPAFYEALRTPVGQNPVSLATGDLNGDGLPDALALNAGGESLSVALNEWGRYPRSAPPQRVGRGPDCVQAADLDGDGHCDAALLAQYDRAARLVLLFGDGTGALRPRAEFAERDVAQSGADLLVADLAGDGRPELVVADRGAGRVILFDNRPAAPGELDLDEPRTLALTPVPVALAALDVAGDAQLELAALLLDGDVQLIFPRDDAPGAAPEHPWLGPRYEPGRAAGEVGEQLAAGDLDGDGRDDLALILTAGRGSPAGFLHVLLQGGDGFRALAPVATGQLPAAVQLGDANGDGRADVFVSSQNTHNVNWWLARPSREGVHLERQPDLGPGLAPLDLSLVDLDRNGALDVLTVNAFSDDLSAIYNLPRSQP